MALPHVTPLWFDISRALEQHPMSMLSRFARPLYCAMLIAKPFVIYGMFVVCADAEVQFW